LNVWYKEECVRTKSPAYKTLYTDACKTCYSISVYTTVFLKKELSVSKHAEDTKKLKIKILI